MLKGCRRDADLPRQKIAKGKVFSEDIKITKGKIEKGYFGKLLAELNQSPGEVVMKMVGS